MAIQISVQSFENFAKEKGGLFCDTYNHCISKVDPNELATLKEMAKEAKALLIKLNPQLAVKLALGSDNFSHAKEVFEDLSSDQIGQWVTAMVEKPDPAWSILIPKLIKSILEGFGSNMIGKIFEIDYQSLKSASTKEVQGSVWLVIAATLTISDSEAVGSLFDS
jgi:hypothetical protein